MYANLLGIFLFATFINYSLQYKCYDCHTITNVKALSESLKQKGLAMPTNVCPDPLTDDYLKDCPGSCIKLDFTMNNRREVVRTCVENVDCDWQSGIVGQVNGTIDYCDKCDKDKCNSAFSTLASASLLGICISFVAFRVIIS